MSKLVYDGRKKPGLKELAKKDREVFFRKEAEKKQAEENIYHRSLTQGFFALILESCLKLGRSPLVGIVNLDDLREQIANGCGNNLCSYDNFHRYENAKLAVAIMQLHGYHAELLPHDFPERLSYITPIAGSTQVLTPAKPDKPDLTFVPIKPATKATKHARLMLVKYRDVEHMEEYGWTEQNLKRFPIVKGDEMQGTRNVDPSAQVFVLREV